MSNGREKGRIVYIDCARAICAIWIVCVWHISDYTIFNIHNTLTGAITSGVLATFIFISGHFMGKKKIDTITSAKIYIKKRLLRFYPLFFLSCTSLYLLHIIAGSNAIVSFKQYILTLCGLSCIITPAPSTIWFISMLFLFYMITPVILVQRTVKRKWIIGTVIYLIFILLYTLIDIDERVLLWYPAYCMGLLIKTENIQVEEFCFSKFCVGIFGFSLLVFIEAKAAHLNFVGGIEFCYAICFVIVILELCKLLSSNRMIMRAGVVVSYASMAMYLFHRQVYGVLSHFTGDFSIMICVLCIIIVFVFSYSIQYFYDYLIDIATKKHQEINIKK